MLSMQTIGMLQSLIDDESEAAVESWLSQFIIGDPVGIQWLYVLLGGIVIFILCRLIYSAMLHGLVGSNHHPANFRKVVLAFGILAFILCFTIVFSDVFGGLMAGFLSVVWLICALIFYFTRRKVVAPQA
ncbi:MAG TPA: hypothetical protein VKA70_18220 [Blastocatellia bacterium]|nr:hypothetical protein [Blastocatellia bacterium]